jgi:hypothetical protein
MLVKPHLKVGQKLIVLYKLHNFLHTADIANLYKIVKYFCTLPHLIL